MTATNGTGPTLLQVLTRADRRWADRRKDDPAPSDYLKHLEGYLSPLVGETSSGDGGASIVDAGELNDLQARVGAAERELASRAAAHDQLVGELVGARDEMERTKVSAERVRVDVGKAEAELERLREENARLRDELAEALDRRAHDEQAVANVLEDRENLLSKIRVLQGKLTRAEARIEKEHVHRYPAPGPGKPLEPCECGKPYPRYFEDVEEEWGEELPDVEPWAELFDRIRDELGEVS